MKKSLLIIAIFMLLTGFASKVFAQSIPLAPWEGAIHTYRVNGIANGSQFEFGVSTTADGYNNTGSFYNITTATTGTVGSDGIASVVIEWEEGAAAAGYYYVWINIIDSDNCGTFRALLVDPIPAITDPYNVNFGIVALQTGDDQTDPVDIIDNAGSTSEESCPAFVDENWLFTTLTDATVNDGYSYVYFRINRSSVTWPSTTWSITPTVSGSANNWEYSNSAAAVFTSFTSGNAIGGITTGNDLYLRARVTNGNSAQDITVSIADGGDDAQTNETATHTENSATLTVRPVPAVGNFGDSE